MVFYSITCLPKPSRSKVCSSKKPNYQIAIDGNGIKYLVKIGDTNIFDEVQMFKDDCNIYNIIKRYEFGDLGVLNKVSSTYCDTLGQPKSLQEALNLSIKLKSNFDNFKPELKASFDNDFNNFLKSVADGSINSILKSFNSISKESESNES